MPNRQWHDPFFILRYMVVMQYDWSEDPEDTAPEPAPASAPQVPSNADYLPESEPQELDEVERRLEKAHFYRMLLRHQLISSESDEAIDVENEIQDFVRERLAVLLGIKTEAQKAATQFTEDEVGALKAVAAKVLGKPGIMQAKPEVKQVTVMPVTERPAPVRPALPPPPVVSPVQIAPPAPIKRGRGRPRKTPVPVLPESPGKSKAEATMAPAAPKVNLRPGERIEDVGGKRYKVTQRVVNDPATGKPKLDENGKVMTAEHRVDISPPVVLPHVAKMPPQEQTNAMEAARATEMMALNPLAAALTPIAMTLPDTTQKD